MVTVMAVHTMDAAGPLRWGPAGLTSRWAAMAIDWVCLLIASYVIFPIPFVLLGATGLACFIGQHVLLVAALAAMWWRWSPGMAALGLKMTTMSGRGIGPWRALVRVGVVAPGGLASVVLAVALYGVVFGSLPSGAEPDPNWLVLGGFGLMALAYGVSTLAAFANAERRAIHDIVAGVVVLERVRPVRPLAEASPVKVTRPAAPLTRWVLGAAALLLALATFVSIGIAGMLADSLWWDAAGFSAFAAACWWGATWLCLRARRRQAARREFRWVAVAVCSGTAVLFLFVIGIDCLVQGLLVEGVAATALTAPLVGLTIAAARSQWRLRCYGRLARTRLSFPSVRVVPVRLAGDPRSWERAADAGQSVR